MDTLLLSVTVTGALLALTLSVVSLVLHWVRRTETPEYSTLSGRITETELSLLNVLDQVKHWRNRDSVRRAREGAQKKLDDQGEGATDIPYKTQLRRRVLAAAKPADAA